jgi:hypothetical protein
MHKYIFTLAYAAGTSFLLDQKGSKKSTANIS